MSIKYSVIVPVYNKAEYLDECIKSILMQKCDELEVLLINDGSIDNSLDICKKYELSDKRVSVYNKQNSGVSDTRNFGIQHSSGKYLIFVDADDVLSDNFIEVVDQNVDGHDVLMYKSCRKIELLGKNPNCPKLTSFDTLSILKNVIYNRRDIDGCGFNFNRVTDYVISSDVVKNGNIRFENGLKVGEDKVFNFDLFQKTINIAYIDSCLYYIRTNKDSVMGSYNPNAFEINKNMYNALEKRICKIDKVEQMLELKRLLPCLGFQIVWNSITSDYCHKKNPNTFHENKEKFNECRSYIKNDCSKLLNRYDRYLLNVFQRNFFTINIIMRNRPIRGLLYYVHRLIKR